MPNVRIIVTDLIIHLFRKYRLSNLFGTGAALGITDTWSAVQPLPRGGPPCGHTAEKTAGMVSLTSQSGAQGSTWKEGQLTPVFGVRGSQGPPCAVPELIFEALVEVTGAGRWETGEEVPAEQGPGRCARPGVRRQGGKEAGVTSWSISYGMLTF